MVVEMQRIHQFCVSSSRCNPEDNSAFGLSMLSEACPVPMNRVHEG